MECFCFIYQNSNILLLRMYIGIHNFYFRNKKGKENEVLKMLQNAYLVHKLNIHQSLIKVLFKYYRYHHTQCDAIITYLNLSDEN